MRREKNEEGMRKNRIEEKQEQGGKGMRRERNEEGKK